MSQFWLTGVSKLYLRADYLLMLKKKIAHLQRCTWPISQSSTGSIPTLIKEKTRCFSDHSLCSELYLQIERITTVVFNLPTFSWKFAIYLQLQQLFWFCCRDYPIKGESYSSTSHSLVLAPTYIALLDHGNWYSRTTYVLVYYVHSTIDWNIQNISQSSTWILTTPTLQNRVREFQTTDTRCLNPTLHRQH